MSTTDGYIEYIKDRLGGFTGFAYRKMMGEYIIYYNEKIAAYVCDNTLLVKDTKSARDFLPEPVFQKPYDGSKEMLAVLNTDDSEFLKELFDAIWNELSFPKPKKKKAKANTEV